MPVGLISVKQTKSLGQTGRPVALLTNYREGQCSRKPSKIQKLPPLHQRKLHLWGLVIQQGVEAEGRDLVSREPTCSRKGLHGEGGVASIHRAAESFQEWKLIAQNAHQAENDPMLRRALS